MADRYLVVAGNWNADANWSATDGGAGGASFPVAGDNAYITAASGTKQVTVNVSSAAANLDCTGSTSASPVLLGANLTLTGTFTLIGSAATRKYLYSTTRGTARTVSAGTVAFQYVDLEDVTGAGAGSWNLSAITGGSGDCGGNSGITFTTPANNWLRGSGNRSFSTAANWANAVDGAAGSGRVPLLQDTAYLDATTGSGTITQDLVRIGALVCTGHTGTLTPSTAATVYGSWTLVSGQTLTASTQAYTLSGRGTQTLTSGTKTWAKSFTVDCPGGKWQLGDALSAPGTGNITLTFTRGTFDDKNYDVSFPMILGTGTTTRAVVKGTGTWTIGRPQSYAWRWDDVTNLTWSDAGTLVFSWSSASTYFQTMGALAYNSVRNATSGGGALILYAPTSYVTFTVDPGAKQQFRRGETHTAATWNLTGTAVSPITLASDTTSTATIAKSGGGTVVIDYATIDYLTGSPASTFFATNSTDGGHNSQIYFATVKTATASLDALLGRTAAATVDLDVLLAATQAAGVDLDALLAGTHTGTLSLDALIQRLGLTRTVSLDAILKSVQGSVVARSRRANVVALPRLTAVEVAA